MIFENGDRLVFAGDSVTDMDSTEPIGEGNGLGCGYVRLVDSFLTAFYPDLKIRVTNAGINGHTSRMLLERFDRDVVSLNPDWVSICIGINDVWRQFDSPTIPEAHVSPEEYEKNVEEMILRIKDRVKGIFLLTPYYMEPNDTDIMRRRMDEYGAICKKLADKHGCYFIDFQAMFNEFFKTCHSSYIAWDRVHPNQKGAMLMAKTFLDACGFDYQHKA